MPKLALNFIDTKAGSPIIVLTWLEPSESKKDFLNIKIMSERRKANVLEATYFITLPVVGWLDIFIREEYSDVIIKNLQFCQKNKDLEIYAYVIMTSHIHLICRRNKGLLSDMLRDFKSYTAKILLQNILENPLESRKNWLKLVFEYEAKYQSTNAKYMFWQKQVSQ